MSSTMTGVAADYDPTVTCTLTQPDDGDALNAASIESNATAPKTGFKPLINALESLRTLGPYAFAAATTWAPGGTWHEDGSTAKTKIYHGPDGTWCRVQNASWDAAGPTWSQDNGALPSVRERYLTTGVIRRDVVAAGAGAPWAEGAWTNGYIYDATTGTLFAAGTISTNAGVSAAGALSGLSLGVTNAAIAGANVQSTGGFVIGALGVQASGGEVVASAGKVQAQGDPASDEARVECKQIIPTTAGVPTIARGVAMDNGVGDGAVGVTGTDIAGNITVTTGAAVAAGGVVCTVTLNKAYPANPRVLISPSNGATTDIGSALSAQSTGNNTFTITATAAFPLIAGGTGYGWTYAVFGG